MMRSVIAPSFSSGDAMLNSSELGVVSPELPGCERGIGVLSNRARHDLSTSSRRTTGRPGMRRKMRSFVRKSEQLQEWPVAA